MLDNLVALVIKDVFFLILIVIALNLIDVKHTLIPLFSRNDPDWESQLENCKAQFTLLDDQVTLEFSDDQPAGRQTETHVVALRFTNEA